MVAEAERRLGLSLPAPLKWLLCEHGYSAACGIANLGETVRMTLAGNRPILKIYPDTGHFIHTDNPVEFPADVVNFVTTGTLDTSSPVEIDHLINGVTASSASKAPTPSSSESPTVGLNK